MKSAIQTTALMGVMAAVATVAAAWFYPWPKAVTKNAQVNKPLFEDYDTSSVRGIEVATYNEDTSKVDRLKLKRKGERWVIPQKSEFDVTGGDRVIDITKALTGRTVLEVTSDSQNDHAKFGVVDPAEANTASSRSSLGSRLELTDRNRKTIGSLIIGHAVKNKPDNHYVRVTGKPTVYTIEFNENILSADFSKWTSPNLLGLPSSQASKRLASTIDVNKYRIAAADKREDVYDIKFAVKGEPARMSVASAKVGDAEIEASQLPNSFLQTVVQTLFQLQIADVVNQSKSAVKALRSKADASKDASISALRETGFFYQQWKDGGHQFDAANGKVSIGMSDGVRHHVLIGGIANQVGGSDSLKLLYRVMLTADVDESGFDEPEKPADIDKDEAIKKAYLREVKERDQLIELALRQAAEFNRKHSMWVYVMDETVVKGLLPEVEFTP